jgi:predicted ABC-type ATPase|tara:strand:- start:1889 stop:2512 length:624 start_codon:yes stop_codon:yes gene_type:complete
VITVIAGVNGAGKSSVAGARLRRSGADYFNPDEVARELLADNAALSATGANARAWQMGYEQLLRAIGEGEDYIFETTLGGNTICQTLHDAIDQGEAVRLFFVGLASPEMHIARVAARVSRGGHPIPEAKIRERWISATHNLMGLIPRCAAVNVFDNSAEDSGAGPDPVCLFALHGDQFVSAPVDSMPDWAKPLASVAITRALQGDRQ